jgi:hypothetical protein
MTPPTTPAAAVATPVMTTAFEDPFELAGELAARVLARVDPLPEAEERARVEPLRLFVEPLRLFWLEPFALREVVFRLFDEEVLAAAIAPP